MLFYNFAILTRKLLTMSPGIQIYVHQQTAHNVTRYTDICTSTNCSQCHQVHCIQIYVHQQTLSIIYLCLHFIDCQ
jgi:hypothetical protein